MSSVKMNDGVKMNFDNIEYTNKLKYANECLGICDDLNIEKSVMGLTPFLWLCFRLRFS